MPSEPAEDGRPLPGAPVDLGTEPLRQDSLEVGDDAAAGDVGEPVDVRLRPQPTDVVEVEARGREQVVAFVVLLLEDSPDEGESVRVHAGGGKPDDSVARLDARAVHDSLALDEPHARAREVELLVAVDAGQLS